MEAHSRGGGARTGCMDAPWQPHVLLPPQRHHILTLVWEQLDVFFKKMFMEIRKQKK